jgi:hypothetical protein
VRAEGRHLVALSPAVSAQTFLWPAGVLACGVLLAGLLASPDTLRLALAGAFAALAIGLASKSPRMTLYCLLVWLTGLGCLRRLVSGVSVAGSVDLLLVVGASAVAWLAIAAAERGAFGRRTRLSHAVLALTVLAFLEAFNPLQGSLLGGLSGLLFVLVPLLAFWAGRAFCDDRTLTIVVWLVALMAPLVALYGHFQTFQGFPSWDEAWVKESGYTALNVGGVIRPFGTFSSASEYVTFLAIGMIVWLSFGLRRSRLLVTALALTIVVPAMFLVSTRGTIFLSAAAIGLVAAARLRLSVWKAAAIAVVIVVGVPQLVGMVAPSAGGGGQSALIAHQLEGLSDPFDEDSSTLTLHLSMVGDGLSQALSHPLGQGIGKVTIAGAKFGGESTNTEADPSNAAVSMGVVGLAAYGVVLTVGLWRAYKRAVERRDGLAFAALGVLVVTFLQWLNGGQYAVALLPWLVLGWLDPLPAPSTAADGLAGALPAAADPAAGPDRSA